MFCLKVISLPLIFSSLVKSTPVLNVVEFEEFRLINDFNEILFLLFNSIVKLPIAPAEISCTYLSSSKLKLVVKVFADNVFWRFNTFKNRLFLLYSTPKLIPTFLPNIFVFNPPFICREEFKGAFIFVGSQAFLNCLPIAVFADAGNKSKLDLAVYDEGNDLDASA